MYVFTFTQYVLFSYISWLKNDVCWQKYSLCVACLLFLASIIWNSDPSFSPCVGPCVARWSGKCHNDPRITSCPGSREIFTCFRISSDHWVNTYRNHFKTNIWYMAPHKCSRPLLFVLIRPDWWRLTVCLRANVCVNMRTCAYMCWRVRAFLRANAVCLRVLRRGYCHTQDTVRLIMEAK